MNKISEENKIIIKNLICFFFSFLQIFNSIIFETDFGEALFKYLGIVNLFFFMALLYVISLVLSLYFFEMTIKYMIEIIRNKKIIIPTIEITIYIIAFINYFKNYLKWNGGL